MATEPRALTVNDLIDERPLSRFQLTTILLCGVVLLLDGFDTQAMGFLVPPIAEELGIPLSSFGPVLSAGLVGLMLGAMASGPIADRWGRKWAIIISSIVFGFFSLLTARADSLNELVLLSQPGHTLPRQFVNYRMPRSRCAAPVASSCD